MLEISERLVHISETGFHRKSLERDIESMEREPKHKGVEPVYESGIVLRPKQLAEVCLAILV